MSIAFTLFTPILCPLNTPSQMYNTHTNVCGEREKGGEGERPAGKWRGWRRGKTSGPRAYVEVCMQRQILAFVSISRYLTAIS